MWSSDIFLKIFFHIYVYCLKYVLCSIKDLRVLDLPESPTRCHYSLLVSACLFFIAQTTAMVIVSVPFETAMAILLLDKVLVSIGAKAASFIFVSKTKIVIFKIYITSNHF